MFNLKSSFEPTGDQPQAIGKLFAGIKNERKNQTLLGVTGSGKTFTVANVIQKTNLPTLLISHNKTLAGQLYQEMREFFPNNHVSYFVSYYDYYQPESYMPASDTYIEKEVQINQVIDKLRLEATKNILTHKDVIVVASVSIVASVRERTRRADCRNCLSSSRRPWAPVVSSVMAVTSAGSVSARSGTQQDRCVTN